MYSELLGQIVGEDHGSGRRGSRGPAPITEEPVAADCDVEPQSDKSNRVLIENVRSPHRKNPEPQACYDLVVLGAGVAGLISCIVARQLGRKVAMVERHYMGGDCLNTGCVPSKALIASARRAALVRSSSALGISAGECSVDFAQVMGRLRQVRADISEHDSVQRYTSEVGVDVFTGQAAFSGPSEVCIEGGPTLSFRKCIVATGASGRVPAYLEGIPHLTSANLWNLTSLPPRLLVLGGGPIGVELAQAMQRLGSDVTLVARSQRLLGKEEPEAADVIRSGLEKSGVRLLLGAQIVSVSRCEGDLYREPFGSYSIEIDSASGTCHAEAEALLNATGRVPNVRGLGLEKLGVHVGEDQGIRVDAGLQTSAPTIYAAGDCLGGPDQFTHAAEWQARLAVRNALLGEGLDAGRLLVPRATYTDPEVAAVGQTSAELRAAGVKFNTFTRLVKDVDRNRCDGADEGFAMLHVARDGKLLGATVAAPHAGEHISEVTLCMQHGLSASDLAGTMHPYPTGAEVVRQAAQAFVRSRIVESETQALLETASGDSPHVAVTETGSARTVELQRPRALNACNVAMVRSLSEVANIRDDKRLVLRGSGSFCAGGDVKALAEAVRANPNSPLPSVQLTYEYRTVAALCRREKQVVALVDRECMGFGLCLALAASHRVVTQQSTIAMPECAIGIVPDVGFAAFAAELPRGLGLCMALTGWRLSGREALAAGLATHLVDSRCLSEVGLALGNQDFEALDRLVEVEKDDRISDQVQQSLELAHDVFASAPDVATVEAKLRKLSSNSSSTVYAQRWAAERLEGLHRGCPRTQALAVHLLRAAEADFSERPESGDKQWRIERALQRDYAVMSRLLPAPDFSEGVRATLIDRDGSPKWSTFEGLEPEVADSFMRSPIATWPQLDLAPC